MRYQLTYLDARIMFVYSLEPGQMYYYMFGDTYGWSREYNFTSAPYHGANTTIRVIAFGGPFPRSPSLSSSLDCVILLQIWAAGKLMVATENSSTTRP